MFYDLIAMLCRPSAWWGRLRVKGLDAVPASGPVLVVPNHDSQWDPVILGLAARPKRRLRFLAQAELWKIPGLGLILDAMHQIPLMRGTGDAAALDRAVEALKSGHAVAIYPEGRLTWGEALRARSGVGLLAGWCPGVHIVLCTIEGTVDYVRFPKRPRVTVTFFEPAGGQMRPGEEPAALASRWRLHRRGRNRPDTHLHVAYASATPRGPRAMVPPCPKA